MPFEQRPGDDPYVIEEYVSGNIIVTIRLYAFGQQRIQVSVDTGGHYPEILGPEC